MEFNALSTIFQLYCGGHFIGGGIRSTRRKPPTFIFHHLVLSRFKVLKEELEDTKGAIGIRISKKNRRHNDLILL